MMNKIVLVSVAIMAVTFNAELQAAENRTPTPEEVREMLRQYNESGRTPALQRQPQIPKGAEQFNRAVALHTKKNPSAKELKEAAALYQTAWDAGIPQAGTNLALLYLEGKGVKKDVKKGLALLNAASAKNESQADLTLARLYLIGKDVPKDEKKAEAILNKAVKAGNQNAVKMLAEYKEWKKKNELAMKQYQDLMKQVQLGQNKQGGTISPLQLLPQSGSGIPFPQGSAKPPFPVIPGHSYVSGLQPPMPNFLAPVVQQPPQPFNILPQGGVAPQLLTMEPKKPTTAQSEPKTADQGAPPK